MQVQRAGTESFSHNEINPNETKSRMLQICVLPEKAEKSTSYKVFTLKKGQMTHVYGGSNKQNETLASHTNIEVGILSEHQKLKKDGDFLAYISNGRAYLNNVLVEDGTLIYDTDLDFKAIDDNVYLSIFSTN
ncbi:MAG: hypothetical protein L3J10_10450 [Sulfurimonas sp.]|nr:hypothetical protein [Sulfurimonas sp.]